MIKTDIIRNIQHSTPQQSQNRHSVLEFLRYSMWRHQCISLGNNADDSSRKIECEENADSTLFLFSFFIRKPSIKIAMLFLFVYYFLLIVMHTIGMQYANLLRVQYLQWRHTGLNF